MYWLDYLIVSLLVLGVLLGAASGLFWQVARVANLAASVYVSLSFHEKATIWLQATVFRESPAAVSSVAAYGLVFAGVYLALFWLTCLVDRGIRVVQLGAINRLLGAGLGLAKMVFVLALACFALAQVPHPQTRAWVAKSSLAPALADGVDWVVTALPSKSRAELAGGWKNLKEMVGR